MTVLLETGVIQGMREGGKSVHGLRKIFPQVMNAFDDLWHSP
jgi:hypothetical protein